MGGVLGYPISRLGYPVVPLRLYLGLLLALPFFTFLAVMAHVRFGWCTLPRQLYLVSGIVAGVFGGYAEAFLVTKMLKKDVEVVAWFLIPLGLVVWLLPTAYVYLVLGDQEFLPFCTYFLLPSIAIAEVTNGFLFRRFEKEEKVRVYSFMSFVPYPKYWIETPETLETELYGFLEAVADKDTTWVLYYGRYAKQLEKLVERLSEGNDKIATKISQIKELTTQLLDENTKFYRKGIRITSVFTATCVLWIVLVFYVVGNNYFGVPPQYGGTIIFSLFPLILVYAFIKRRILTRDYEKTVQTVFAKTNSKTQNTIKEILDLMS